MKGEKERTLVLLAEVGSIPIITIRATDTNRFSLFSTSEVLCLLKSEKQIPPVSSKQQGPYSTEIKQKTNVLLCKPESKQTMYENNA